MLGSLHVDDAAPTLLLYGHYDVQPPDPLDQWHSEPFEPDLRDGCIWARGANDDKGQLFTHVKSVEAWMKSGLKPGLSKPTDSAVSAIVRSSGQLTSRSTSGSCTPIANWRAMRRA